MMEHHKGKELVINKVALKVYLMEEKRVNKNVLAMVLLKVSLTEVWMEHRLELMRDLLKD